MGPIPTAHTRIASISFCPPPPSPGRSALALYAANSRKDVGKKHKSARDKSERFSGPVFASILHIDLEEIHVCVFFLFSSKKAYFCSFTFTNACL